jgi:hypothetical protein
MAVLARILINRVAVARNSQACGSRSSELAQAAESKTEETAEEAMFAEAERLLLSCSDAPAHARLLATMYLQRGRLEDAVAQARVSLAQSRLQFGDEDDETRCDIALVQHIAKAKAQAARAAVGAVGPIRPIGPIGYSGPMASGPVEPVASGASDSVASKVDTPLAVCAACGSTSRRADITMLDGPNGPNLNCHSRADDPNYTRGTDGTSGPNPNRQSDGNRRPKWCSGCRTVRYCSIECQRKHRPDHRVTCSAVFLENKNQQTMGVSS